MADLSIRKDFLDGTQEIFTTLFNDGVTDGLNLYLLSDKLRASIYGECKYKKYKEPIKLVCRVKMESHQGSNYMEVVKKEPQFVVPFNDMQQKGLDVSNDGLLNMKKGVIEFHGDYYTIDEILPVCYIADTYLFYHFMCTEDVDIHEIAVESGDNNE